jgi:hypothetical protein
MTGWPSCLAETVHAAKVPRRSLAQDMRRGYDPAHVCNAETFENE